MDKVFVEALSLTLGFEGGVSDDKDDLGGLTNMGVTQDTYNEYRKRIGKPTQTVTKITKAEVSDLYHKLFWLPSGCDTMPEAIAKLVFDTAVNCGTYRGAVILQNILGGRHDGIWDDRDLNNLKYYLSKHSESKLVSTYLDSRANFHKHRAQYKNQGKFLEGWLNRVEALREALV